MKNPASSNNVTRGKGVRLPKRSVRSPTRKRAPRVINILGTSSMRSHYSSRLLEEGKGVGSQNIDNIPLNDSHGLLLGLMIRNSGVLKDLKPFVWQ